MAARNHLIYLADRNRAFFIALAVYAIVMAVLFQLGWLFSDVIVTSGIFFILVMSLDLAVGYAGLLSLGHTSIFAIGAYVVAVLLRHSMLSFWPATIVALVFNVVLGAVLGSAFLRLRGSYFMLGTLAFGLAVHAVLRIWGDVTGGDAGLGGLPRPAVFGTELRTDFTFGALVWFIAVVLFWLSMNLTRSRVGRALRAIRSDEISAAAAGIDVGRLKVAAFSISAGYASISGSLFASYNGAVHPDSFSLSTLLDLLMMLFFGGEGTIWGALFGSTIMRILPDLTGSFHAGKLLLSGLIFVVILFVFPRGIAGAVALLRRRFGYARRKSITPTARARIEPNLSGTSQPVLQVAQLGKAFGGLRAVDDVSFEVRSGQIKSLIGPNGAGKTTLLNLISGVLKPDQGSIRVNGVELGGTRSDRVARLGVQRTFQHERLFGQLTVLENVMIGAEGGTKGTLGDLIACTLATGTSLEREYAARTLASRWLASVGLADKADEQVASLPHGQRKLVELARTAAANPTVLMLDETAAGLNDTEKMQLKALVRDFRDQGTAVIVIEHDTDFVMELSDEIVVMNFGRKIADGSPSAVSEDRAVLEAYLGT
ncbi:MAG: branched-chain amino acid ABC transporter ATP-binding protein/permease [Methylobacteriaceae bacterium]|nr:branched-chain amino acid ABC transporter ATP-binding protein/permease [Methylobacteriaceae bacterium]